MTDDKNCGTCHWRHWTAIAPEPGRWECRNLNCGSFGYSVNPTDGAQCQAWAEGKQLGTPFSQLTQSRFEEIGRTWGYD